ncbi:MAG: Glutamate-tRNA ligase [Parcubacteria group bacterium GW2011_GWC1_41_7]|nr:MAG: Glutamate-tRNA ligase [Parcubacteria group bacterium GW2011_GWC1_41_7]
MSEKEIKIESPRVRFAPSPTGYMHMGSARTALFNFLVAKKYKGTFLLRIEDTDSERSLPEYEADIFEQLRWLGLHPDEESIRQSSRSDLYEGVIKQLLSENKVFRCFCDKAELEEERQRQILEGKAPKYKGTCAHLTENEIQQKIDAGLPSVIRLRVPPQKTSFQDLIRGEVKVDLDLVGDFVIAKSEHQPLFHLATPVDDHYQGITHIIRGEDHIPNTAKQMMIFKAMGWNVPVFAHLPLILGEGGGKMSKRHGSTSVREYRQAGYLPEALNNFLVLLGWHPKDDREILSLDNLIAQFDIERVQKKGAVFNVSKLHFLNRHYMKQKSSDELLSLAALPDGMYEKEGKYIGKNGIQLTKQDLIKIIELGKERAHTIGELFSSALFLWEDFDYDAQLLLWKDYGAEKVRLALQQTLAVFEQADDASCKNQAIKLSLDDLSSDKGLVYWPLRVALSGLKQSPPPLDIVSILGKEKSIERIKKAICKLSTKF